MHLLGWADNRTLVACHCLLAAVFGVMLLVSRRLHEQMDGIGSMAVGCLLGIPAMILIGLRGSISPFASTVCAGALTFLGYIFLYRGILRFNAAQNGRLNDGRPCAPPSPRSGPGAHSSIAKTAVLDPRYNRPGYKGHEMLLYVCCGIGFSLLYYFTEVDPQLKGQIVAASGTLAIARALMAISLFRNAAGRLHLLLFGWSLAGFSIGNLYHAIITVIHGAPRELLEFDRIHTASWIASLIFIGVNGMFYLTMINMAVIETIEEKAQLDFVTATLNRSGIQKALNVEIERARRSKEPLSILLVDVDHFKQVNDLSGHEAGDQALRSISRCISASIRSYDKLGRFGGDEFLVLLPDTYGDQAMFFAARLRGALGSLELPAGASKLTLSVGVTHSIAPEDASQILKRADAALYQAKQAGRDCARLLTAGLMDPAKPQIVEPTLT